MSYQIYYDKQFIKVADNLFIPITCDGPNNCTQSVRTRRGWREVRERSMDNNTFFSKGKIIATKEEVIQSIEDWRNDLIKSNQKNTEQDTDRDIYNDKNFGYFASCSLSGKHTTGTTYSAFKSMFIDGLKKAATVEQLVEHGISVTVGAWCYDREKTEKEIGKVVLDDFCPKTTQELVSAISKFEKYYKGLNIRTHVSIDDDFKMTRIKRMRKTMFGTRKKKEKVYKEVDKFFVINFIGYGYFVKATRNGIRYSPYDTAGKKFTTEKDAQAYCKKLNDKYLLRKFSVEIVNKTTTMFA